MKDKTNEVRQVLMNELGLTRESVREEMQKIVEQTIERNMSRIQEFIEKAVAVALNNMVVDKSHYIPTIRSLVIQAATKQVEQFINDNLKIGVKENG